MVVVLIVGFTAFAFAAMWLKKRLDDRHPGLYHGDDRNYSSSNNNNSTRMRSPIAGFAIPASLRNFSARNSMSNTGTPNNASQSRNINYHGVPTQPPMAPYARSQHGGSNPNMSMSSLSNGRAEAWGPHQASAHTRNFGEISPADDPAYAANASRTDVSSTPQHSHRGHEPVSPVSPIH